MKLKTKVCALSLALTLGCSILAACGGKKPSGEGSTSTPADSTSQPADSTSQPAASTSQPAASTSQPAASTSQPAASTSQPAASTSNPPSTTSEPPVVKYLVTLPTSNDYSITGINREGYAQGEKVSFRVVLSNNEKEIVSVGYDTTTLTAKQDGSYEFNMPGKNVLLFVNTKDVEHYALSHSGNVQVDGDPVTFILKLGTDPVSDDFTLEAVSGGEHISINGEQVTGVSEGEVVLAAKINGQEVARETFTVAASAYKTFRQAIDDAWASENFRDNSKNTSSTNKYKMRAKVVFMGSVYNSKVEMLLDDGTAIIDYQVNSTTDIDAFAVGDVIEIEEKLTNYYGLIEATSSDVKYAKKVEGVTINTTSFVDALTGSAYDEIYSNNMVNSGEHKIVPVNLQATAKKVDDKNRYEVPGAEKGLLATTKSVINLDFVEGATYNFKGYLLNWNDSSSAKYCNFVAIEQTKLAANSVAIDQEDFELAVNTSKQLTYTTDPLGAGQSIVWSVEQDGQYITLSEDGLVEGKAAGEAVVKITVDGHEDTVNITVIEPVAATSAQFSEESITINNVQTYDLNDILSSLPAGNSDDKNKEWSVSPSGVITVKDGVVTPVAAGTATVTVTYNASVSASISVTVRQQKISDLAHAKVNDPVDTYGYVTGKYPASGRSGLWVADGDYGMYLNHAPKDGMVEGAIVHVVGKISAFHGGKQVAATTYEVVESFEGLTTPTVLALDETAIAGLDETFQGRQARVTGVVKSHTNQGQAGAAHHTITLDVGAQTMKIYVHKDNCGADVCTDFDRALVGKQVTVSGFVTANKSNVTDFTKLAVTDYQLINPTLESVSNVQATGLTMDKETAEVRQGEALQLTASANPSGSDLPAPIQWSVSGNDKVTVSDSGLVSVAADAVAESTATVKATSGTLEATCVITVKASGSAVTTVLNLDYAALLAGGITTTAGVQTFTQSGLTITISRGTANVNNSDVRVYANETITFSATNITSIVFTCSSSNPIGNFADAEGLDKTTSTWTGSAASVTFTATAQVRMTNLVVTFTA